MIKKLWQQIISLFTEKTTATYMIKRVDKYYGLQGCSYIKKEVLVNTDSTFDYRVSMMVVNKLQREGWFIVTKERFDSVEGL